MQTELTSESQAAETRRSGLTARPTDDSGDTVAVRATGEEENESIVNLDIRTLREFGLRVIGKLTSNLVIWHLLCACRKTIIYTMINGT